MLLFPKNSCSKKNDHSGPNFAEKLTDPCNTGFALMIFFKILHSERKQDQENYKNFAKLKKGST